MSNLIKASLIILSILTFSINNINSNQLRFLEDKDWKGFVNIKNNVKGFDENAEIKITNNVNGKIVDQEKSELSSKNTVSAEEEKKVFESHKHNLLNSKQINVVSEDSYRILIKVIESLTDTSKISFLTLNFADKAPFSTKAKEAFSKLSNVKFLSISQLKGKLTASIFRDLVENFKLEKIFVKNCDFAGNSDILLDSLIRSSSNTLVEFKFVKCNLSNDFYKLFGSKSTTFVKLFEVTFAGQGLNDDLLKEAFNGNSSIEKYYLPKNKITDIGLLYLTEVVINQMGRKVYPWVIDVSYNSIEMKTDELYANFTKIGERKETYASFAVEIYENPLSINRKKKDELFDKYSILFNDFDNEGEWDDL